MAKKRSKMIRGAEAVGGGVVVNLALSGVDKLDVDEKIKQFAPAILGVGAAVGLWMGNEDVQDISLGALGAVGFAGVDEVKDALDGFSRQQSMNGVNKDREYQEVKKERPDMDDVREKAEGYSSYEDAEIIDMEEM